MATPLLLVTHFLILVAKAQAKIPAVIVFGDSTVDTGNNNVISTILKSNFEPYGRDFAGGRPTGRFCNGRVPSDLVSEALGLKPAVPAYLDPTHTIADFATGVCFASAGTGYDTETSSVLSVIPLWMELEYYKDYQKKLKEYLGKKKANTVLSEALYFMSIGTNDFLENYYIFSARSSQFTVEQYQDFLLGIAGNFIQELHGLGARRISLVGLPPLGCVPLERTLNFLNGGACVEEFNNAAVDYNEKLKLLAVKLNQELPGLKMVPYNPYNILIQAIQEPSSYGFDEAAEACCATGMFEMSYLCNQYNPLTCADASKYVFWDSFHPTERTYGIMTEEWVRTILPEFNVSA